MEEKEIACYHCGGVRLVRDPEIDHVKVQQKDPETDEPVGPWQTFYIYRCLACGQRVYVEKKEETIN